MPVGADLHAGLYLAFLLVRKKPRDGRGAAFAVAADFEVSGSGQQFPAVSKRSVSFGSSYILTSLRCSRNNGQKKIHMLFLE